MVPKTGKGSVDIPQTKVFSKMLIPENIFSGSFIQFKDFFRKKGFLLLKKFVLEKNF